MKTNEEKREFHVPVMAWILALLALLVAVQGCNCPTGVAAACANMCNQPFDSIPAVKARATSCNYHPVESKYTCICSYDKLK